MCCSGAGHMVSGDLNRIESGFAAAALNCGLWSSALNLAETGRFGATLLPPGGVATPRALFVGGVGWGGRPGPTSGRIVGGAR
jgi:hypothetical protein